MGEYKREHPAKLDMAEAPIRQLLEKTASNARRVELPLADAGNAPGCVDVHTDGGRLEKKPVAECATTRISRTACPSAQAAPRRRAR